MTRLGPMCRIQFSTERAEKKIRWTQTRRLTTGSLVALSTADDGFKAICMPAIIADHPIRDGLDQTPPTIQIFWANTGDAILDPTTELVMLESRMGYFEAVRHSMVGLQHVAKAVTPFDKYLVSLDKGDLAAKYVLENPEMNISSLVHHVPSSSASSTEAVCQTLREAKDSWKNYRVLEGIDDKISLYTNLDNSQLSAVHRILTKELAIIQGPPGTGKTFTSVQALQILLESQKERGSNVIVVAAQTNHAVDQILTQLIKLGFNTVRLGGRTENEDIKRYNMFNLRRHTMPLRSQNEDRKDKMLEATRRKNISRLEEIVASIFSDGLMDPVALKDAGIISQRQLESLSAEDDWSSASPADIPSGLLAPWLGDQRIEAPSIVSSDPEFETPENDDKADFEAEDYDIELDDCITDDDQKRGRVDGRWIPIEYQWTGSNPRHRTEHDLVIRKELKRENLWDIGKQYRGAIYQYWQRELLRLRRAEFQAELAASIRICTSLKASRWLKDSHCVRMAQVEIIGCTTTGLCKYRGLLAALKPRTMLIEEAAETKEANILSALYPSLQQLILVGDHQQLAPSCDTPYLDEEPYNIRMSMFERLVKLNMPYTMLNMQRRMHTTLRALLNPFYPDLKDHPVVNVPGARPPVPGMGQQSFFFHHTWSEGTDENLSKYNILEAEMIVNFINYLFMNGVQGTEITVLTFYRGQRKKILHELRKLHNREPFTNVHTVDSYQGEENDIVILSLVRSNGSNGPHNAGFLRDSNRGVVSISRARRGFYIFGNMINLLHACEESWAMWHPVQAIFQSQNRFGNDSRLPITCQQHDRTTWISHPDEWLNHHGGCMEPCQEKLQCGHDCGRRCHWIQHSRLICFKPCERALSCGHRCQRFCGERCICTCEAFTGAYATDEAWDDANLASNGSGPVAPFTGRDGRIGRLRETGHGSRGRRSGFGHSGRPEQASRHAGSQYTSIKSIPLLSRQWANFDAQQDDEKRRLEYKNRQGLAREGQDTSNKAETIRETFRQVTLNECGEREVGRGVVSERTRTSSPDEAENTLGENINVSRTPQNTEGLLELSDSVDKMNLAHLQEDSGASSYSMSGELVEPSIVSRENAFNGHSLLDSQVDMAYYSQRSNAGTVIQSYVPRMSGDVLVPVTMRNANIRASTSEDEPEWGGTSTQNDDNTDLHDNPAESGDNLIDF
ncbi:P-loop containing nucleoside triphosphate hydrolase protein [Xylaria nigripes]|nr:P-loop containing nucleoside triphosphate hydrolase protein [Xylaria nigripes]